MISLVALGSGRGSIGRPGRAVPWRFALGRDAAAAACALALFVLARPAIAQKHGMGAQKSCTLSAGCVPFTPDCTSTAVYADGFDDALLILQSYDIVDPGGLNITVPAAGSLPIQTLTGNAVAIGPATAESPLGTFPVLIGPPGSMAAHPLFPGFPLPGDLTADGKVQVRSNQYEVTDASVSPLPIETYFIWIDTCDSMAPDCDPVTLRMATASALIDVFNPGIAVDKTASTGQVCPGVPTEVTFTYTVTNTGDDPLHNVVIVDDQFGVPSGPDGDVGGDGILGLDETWVYTSVQVLAGGVMNTVTVTAYPVGSTLCQATATDELTIIEDCGKPGPNEKGSLVIFSKVEIRWDAAGNLLQDTFLSLTNDYPDDVRVQLYFVNGDPPLPFDPVTGERSHTGWNWVDNLLQLTDDQPTYWSALTGLPAGGGLSPYTVLDPGSPPGRPAPDGSGERVLRGFVVGWAVDAQGDEIRWNHLKGEGTLVNYALGSAWEYGSWNFRAVAAVAHGAKTGTPGMIALDGAEFSTAFDQLLLDFQAVGSSAFSGPRLVVSDTDLTLQPVPLDLRQETDGPVTTKADFTVWNMNEVKFSNARRCITCWDQTLLSDYEVPNNFLLVNLQTDFAKARIDGVASSLCDVDVIPGDGPCGSHPDDVCSQAAPLLGVVARHLRFDGGVDWDAAGTNLVGLGSDDTAVVLFDVNAPPPESSGAHPDQPPAATTRSGSLRRMGVWR